MQGGRPQQVVNHAADCRSSSLPPPPSSAICWRLLPGDSMLTGVALAFLTYALFSCTDAIVKGLGPELPVAEIVFFATLFQSLVILILRPRGERWRDVFRMNHPKRVALRALCGILAGLLGTY